LLSHRAYPCARVNVVAAIVLSLWCHPLYALARPCCEYRPARLHHISTGSFRGGLDHRITPARTSRHSDGTPLRGRYVLWL